MLQRNQIATSFLPAPGAAAGRVARREGPHRPMTTRSPSWRSASPQSARARRPSWSGWSSIRRSIPPAPAPQAEDLLDADRFPVFATGRGGEYTYHGPGQRVAYVMLDLKRRREDVRAFVAALEAWIIGALAAFNVKGERREDRVGVWVARPDKPPLARRPARRGQDRGDRHPAAALGELSRHRAQRRAGPFAFLRHRALRRDRPRRHQPRRSRPAGDDGRCRRRAAGRLRRRVRAARRRRATSCRQDRRKDMRGTLADSLACRACCPVRRRAFAQQAADVRAAGGRQRHRRQSRPSTRRSRWWSPPIRIAAEAGIAVLRNGGNAADALVAVQAVLGLVEPQSSGLGGGAFLTWYDAETGKVTTFDARETAPAAATRQPVPGCGRQAARLLRRGGRRPLGRRAGRAAAAGDCPQALRQRSHGRSCSPARSSSPRTVSPSRRAWLTSIADDVGRLDLQPSTRAYFFDAGGAPLKAGTTLRIRPMPRRCETIAAQRRRRLLQRPDRRRTSSRPSTAIRPIPARSASPTSPPIR